MLFNASYPSSVPVAFPIHESITRHLALMYPSLVKRYNTREREHNTPRCAPGVPKPAELIFRNVSYADCRVLVKQAI